MNNPPNELHFETCRCQYCDGGIEFDASHAGETVSCPHCGIETLLFVPVADAKPDKKNQFKVTRRATMIFCGGLLVIVVVVIGSLLPDNFFSETDTRNLLVSPDSPWRTAQGQIYNVNSSPEWNRLYTYMEREGMVDTIRVVEFDDNYVICEVSFAYGYNSKRIAVENLAQTGITSDSFVPLQTRVMKIDNVEMGSDILEAFDYGIPSAPPK